LLISSSDHSTCRLISPSVVLDRGLDGEELGWVRDHLRFCEGCRKRVEAYRERSLGSEVPAFRQGEGQVLKLGRAPRLREGHASGFGAVVAQARRLSVGRRASDDRGRAAPSRRYAIAGVMAVVLAGLFVSSSSRFAADAVKPSPISSTLFEMVRPSAEPSPSASPEPSRLPATSQDVTSQTAIAPSTSPTPAPTRVPTPAPVAAAPPAVRLTVTPLSGLSPLAVTADASRSTDGSGIVRYVYDFGDGTARALGAITTHTYCRPGKYQLSVTVTNSLGLSSTAYWPVYVYPPEPPVSC